MIALNNYQLEQARILKTSQELAERDPVRKLKQMQDKFLSIAAGDQQAVKQWFVLRVGHKREINVYNFLQNTGIEAWMPLKKTLQKRRFNKPSKPIEVPIFDGYLFVKVVPCAESWVGLSRIEGVVSLLFGQHGALVVSQEYMNDLMALTGSNIFNELRPTSRYQGGERVEYPLAGNIFNGVVEGYVGTRAVRVLSFIFGQQRVIEVPLANIIKSD